MAAPPSDSALQTRLERLRRRLAHAEEAHRRGQASEPVDLRRFVKAAEQAAEQSLAQATPDA